MSALAEPASSSAVRLGDNVPWHQRPRRFPGSLGAIVYLTQGKSHSSYGQSTMEQLRKSVKLLYQNYNTRQGDDVIFLHTGDVTAEQQASVLKDCGPEARFVELAKRHFELPTGVDPSSKEWLFPQKFSVGYRHMIRFFTVGIWEVAAATTMAVAAVTGALSRAAAPLARSPCSSTRTCGTTT